MTNEELEQKVKRLEEQLTEVRIELLERKADEKFNLPYQVKIPDNLEDHYTIDIDGSIEGLYIYTNEIRISFYLRGLAFKTRAEAEQHDRECILLFKLHKWAEEHNGGWTPNWKDDDEEKYTVRYDYKDNRFVIFYSHSYKEFSKLPCFISLDIAEQFIEEFGDEIIEVFC